MSMNLFPPPKPSVTPAGVFVHVSQITNFISDSGRWRVVDFTSLEPLSNELFYTTLNRRFQNNNISGTGTNQGNQSGQGFQGGQSGQSGQSGQGAQSGQGTSGGQGGQGASGGQGGQGSRGSQGGFSNSYNNLTNVSYDNLDWDNVPLDYYDPDVQAIINPNIYRILQLIRASGVTDDLGRAIGSQLNNLKVELIDKKLYEQGVVKVTNNPTNLKSGYRNLNELLKIAGDWAPILGKNPKINYNNLKSSYKAGVHGLPTQGTQAVIVALTGIPELGKISGHADWFSFKNPSTDNGTASFSISVDGKEYYNDKVKVGKDFITDKSKWEVGDVIAMGYTDGKPFGYIQVWTGWKWVSDFTQNGIQENSVDFNTVALWRLNQNGKEIVQLKKNKTT